MIRNIRLKKFLVDVIFPAVTLANHLIPKKEQVFFYNANDGLRDNSEAMFRYMLEKGMHEKIPIVTNVPAGDVEKLPRARNVSYIEKKAAIWTYLRSRYVFYSFGKLPIFPTKKQQVMNLWHGIPLKTIANLSKIGNGREFFFSYVIASSELYRPIIARAFGCPEENVFITGEPKTDPMYSPKQQRQHDHPGQQREAASASEKYLVWAPTFRQSSYFGYSDSSETDLLPLLAQSNWERFNDFLREEHVHVLVKLHGGQNLNGFREKIMSNMEVYSDQAFRASGKNLYYELSQSDALLADYSSVYLEYLALNRPIGFIIEDMEEYQDSRGFVFSNPLDYMPGDKIRNLDQLKAFIHTVAAGQDPWLEKRTQVADQVNQYKDGHNCERVLRKVGLIK